MSLFLSLLEFSVRRVYARLWKQIDGSSGAVAGYEVQERTKVTLFTWISAGRANSYSSRQQKGSMYGHKNDLYILSRESE